MNKERFRGLLDYIETSHLFKPIFDFINRTLYMLLNFDEIEINNIFVEYLCKDIFKHIQKFKKGFRRYTVKTTTNFYEQSMRGETFNALRMFNQGESNVIYGLPIFVALKICKIYP